MKLELKSVIHSASLSQEIEAFTAKTVNRGNGRPTHATIQPEFRSVMDENSLLFLDIEDLNPIDYSSPPKSSGESKSKRLPKEERKFETSNSYIVKCIDRLLYYWLKMKDIKKYKTAPDTEPITVVLDNTLHYRQNQMKWLPNRDSVLK